MLGRIIVVALLLLGLVSSAAHSAMRVALVIGNSAYKHARELSNPRNDAADISAALSQRGFRVIERFDLDKAAFDRKVRDFGYRDTYYACLAQLQIEELKKQQESVSPEAIPRLAHSPSAGAPRNPFGVEDVGDPYGEDVRQFARRIQPPGGSGDRNAAQWSPSVTTGQRGTLDGEWFGRWEIGSAGTGRIQVVGNRLYALYTDQAGRMTGKTWILEAVIESRDRLVGRWMQVGRPSDTGPFVGLIVGDDRIDGIWNWGGTGRWDFRRKLKR